MKEIELYSLQEDDIDEIVSSFKEIGWEKPRKIFESYLKEQSQKLRVIFVAKFKSKFAGYVTLKWTSDYLHFKENEIPEISDLNVLPKYQRRGIGTILIKACEKLVQEKRYNKIGLGVGVTSNYGNAQRLYVNLGYIPDGKGIHHFYKPVDYFQTVVVDDDLVLFLEKKL